MNLSQKMMLVPAGRVPLEISTLSELDKAMSSVLNNQKLSNLQKINLYSKILNKNLIMEERLKSKNVDTQSVPKPENIKNEAIKQEINENELDLLNKRILKSDPEDENMELSFLANQSYSDILKKKENKAENRIDDIKITKELNQSNKKKTPKSNEKNQILITPPQQIKWDKLPKAPANERTRKKIINYEHKYPGTEYTGVGFKNHYSPD
jgi:hypothetical protein